jgi:thiamine pyrophosphokinase
MADDQVFEWHPAKFLRTQDPSPEFSLLVLNQPLRNGNNLRKLWRNCQSSLSVPV